MDGGNAVEDKLAWVFMISIRQRKLNWTIHFGQLLKLDVGLSYVLVFVLSFLFPVPALDLESALLVIARY